MFRFWAPLIYGFYLETIARVQAHDPSLKDLKRTTAFPAMTFNFGPDAVTLEHVDSQNYAGGFCVVTSLGAFDHTRGGHLFVRELGLVAEFPAGATILLPSALLNHGNTPIQQGEWRASMTMFASGHLFRHVDQGHLIQREVTKSQVDAYHANAPEKLAQALERFSTMSSLLEDQRRVFGGQ